MSLLNINTVTQNNYQSILKYAQMIPTLSRGLFSITIHTNVIYLPSNIERSLKDKYNLLSSTTKDCPSSNDIGYDLSHVLKETSNPNRVR